MAYAYNEAGLKLWIVLLNDTPEGRTADINALVDYGVKNVQGEKVVGKGKKVGKVRIKHGAKTSVPVYTSEIAYAYLPKQASSTLIGTKAVLKDDIEAPVKAGTVVGTYDIYVADEYVNSVDLIIKEDVEAGWFTSYLGISNKMAVLIGALIILVVSFILWVNVQKAKQRRRKKQRRKEKIRQIALKQMED